MPRRSAFAFEILDIHLQPSMQQAFIALESLPTPFDLSLTQKLEALKRLFDSETHDDEVSAAS